LGAGDASSLYHTPRWFLFRDNVQLHLNTSQRHWAIIEGHSISRLLVPPNPPPRTQTHTPNTWRPPDSAICSHTECNRQ
jgi:hypothetical protein